MIESKLSDQQLADLNREHLPNLINRAQMDDAAAQGIGGGNEYYPHFRESAYRWRKMAREAYWDAKRLSKSGAKEESQ